MAKLRAAKRARPRASGKKQAARRRPANTVERELRALKGATRTELAGVVIEVGRAGAARVKRVIYPAGFRWSTQMKPIVGTELCMHAHVGFLATGEIHVEYGDGCVMEHKAPQIVAIEPGHDGWVVGRQPAVLIEFDFERDTIGRLGMPASHRHP